MRRKANYLLVGAVSAIGIACHDSFVAPAGEKNLQSGSSISYSKSSGQAVEERRVVSTLTISATGGTYRIGDFEVVIPAGAVCDPSRTAYGPKHWDRDCVPANRDITVDVVAKRHGGGVSIDFKPDLRFRPSAGWVIVRTSAYRETLTSSAVRQLSPNAGYFSNFAILYAPSEGQGRIDEVKALGDPTLVTYVDLSTGTVWRRVKHFSGYTVDSGFKCDPTTASTDPTCVTDGGLGGAGSVGGTSFSTLTLDSAFQLPSVIVISSDTVATDSTSVPQ